MIKLGVSLMLEENFLTAFLPLYTQGLVQCLEWSFDTGLESMPGWAFALLNDYAEQGALLGHGVSYSLFSDNDRQLAWLRSLEESVAIHNFALFSEHFGFTQSVRYLDNAPLPVPYSEAFLERGRANLERLNKHACTRVGLENLAFAFSREEVLQQGAFLGALLQDQPQAFLLLDLHNLYCQATNFAIDPFDLLATYPLERVVEIHMAGGRVEPRRPEANSGHLRRDTHDRPIPEELFALLEYALAALPNLEYVIYERLGSSLAGESDKLDFQKDYLRLGELVANMVPNSTLSSAYSSALSQAVSSRAQYKDDLTTANSFLERLSESLSVGGGDTKNKLSRTFHCYAPYIESMQEDMIGLAARLYQTWGVSND